MVQPTASPPASVSSAAGGSSSAAAATAGASPAFTSSIHAYLDSQSQLTLTRLYSTPAGCLSIFRCVRLPPCFPFARGRLTQSSGNGRVGAQAFDAASEADRARHALARERDAQGGPARLAVDARGQGVRPSDLLPARLFLVLAQPERRPNADWRPRLPSLIAPWAPSAGSRRRRSPCSSTATSSRSSRRRARAATSSA